MKKNKKDYILSIISSIEYKIKRLNDEIIEIKSILENEKNNDNEKK